MGLHEILSDHRHAAGVKRYEPSVAADHGAVRGHETASVFSRHADRGGGFSFVPENGLGLTGNLATEVGCAAAEGHVAPVVADRSVDAQTIGATAGARDRCPCGGAG